LIVILMASAILAESFEDSKEDFQNDLSGDERNLS